MNIFVLDQDPHIAASYVDDVRLPKMAVESAQMLASACVVNGATPDMMPLTQKGTPYRGGYPNHPCTIWATRNRANFMWLYKHGLGLCEEYTRRFVGKRHSCHNPIIQMGKMAHLLPEGELTPFAQAMPDEYKHEDPVVAYRAYYKGAKPNSKGGVRYRLTSWPDWWHEEREEEPRDDEKTAYLKTLWLI